MRGSIEEAEELQDEDRADGGGNDDDERQGAKPASRERQKEIFGRLPPSDKPSRGRHIDHSPYESKQHYRGGHDNYDDYDY